MRNTFTKLFVIGTVCISVHVNAQFDPYYTHYMLNKLAFNPATAGEKDAICVNALTHQQWLRAVDENARFKNQAAGTQGPFSYRGVNPATNTISITAPIFNNKIGVGFQAITDKVGHGNQTYMRGSVAYKIRMGRKLPDGSTDQTLAIGADFGMAQVTLDGTKYYAIDPDPNVPQGLVKGASFDMGAGIYYTHQRIFDGIYAGFSMTHLNNPKVPIGGVLNWDMKPAMYFLAGTRHNLGAISLLPSMLIKTAGKVQVDLGARILYMDKFVGGLNYRSGDAISVMLGYYFKPNIYIGYSYDVTVSAARKYSPAGAHEIFVSYCFDISSPVPPQVKPRYNVRYLEGYTVY